MTDEGQHTDEARLIGELYALIRVLHRKKQADELIESFEAVFASHEDDGARLSIIEYWHDFYRLRQYRRLKRRRRPTMRERMTPCSACGYPASHRHHLWDVAMHGENKVTVQLCANCHELHHMMYNALARDSEYSRRLVHHILTAGRVPFEVAEKVLGWCRATIKYEADNGWLERYRATDEWLQLRLNWAAYVQLVKSSKQKV